MTEQSEELYEAAKELRDAAEDIGDVMVPLTSRQTHLLYLLLRAHKNIQRAISRYERTRLGMLTEVPVKQ